MVSDPRERALYTIGQFAKFTGFPVKTLRYYDEVGVLKPAFVDSDTGYRSYTEAQRKQMHFLAQLHVLDLTVEMLRDFMRDPTLEHQGALIDWKIAQLEQEIRDRQQGLESLKRVRAYPWSGQQYEVIAEERSSRSWACVHYVTQMKGFEKDREQAFRTVRAFLTRRGVTPAGSPMVFSLPIQDMRGVHKGVEVYAGFELTDPVPAEGEVLVGTTPSGFWYGVKHTGPYEHIWHVMTMLFEHLQRSGVRVQRGAGEFLQQEVFHVGPWDTAEAGRWVTDVRWLVRPDDSGCVVPRVLGGRGSDSG
ncbi:hypothetical protein GCM10010840_35550 [Deinococcus aerolatus]|uniref:HTH merR-type domain-containing protein n=1 Tax=Deinococcus aerolatus TaxID=522487 RepID=A0ABQ2GFT4_9DEIO|nr:MerR family transcriptional regulator [Deinococcus aerolatus]GGL94426.1 hypothetical protein GCM10010840_35550 [Deinococcus aerolatus]